MSSWYNQSRPKYINHNPDDPNNPHTKGVNNIFRLLNERLWLCTKEVQFVPPSKKKILRHPLRCDLIAVSPDGKMCLAVEVDGGYHKLSEQQNRNEDIKEAMPYVTHFLHISPEDALIDNYVIKRLHEVLSKK